MVDQLNTFASEVTRVAREVGTEGRLGGHAVFIFKQKTAYDIGLGIPAEPLFRSTFSVKVLNLFSRSRRKTNKRKSKHSAMLRNKETRHRMFIGLLNTTRKLA